MKSYQFQVYRPSIPSVDSLRDIIQSKSIASILFPALLINQSEKYRFVTPQDLVKVLPDSTVMTGDAYDIYLLNDSDKDLYLRVRSLNERRGQAITLFFTTQHVEQELITLDHMLYLLEQITDLTKPPLVTLRDTGLWARDYSDLKREDVSNAILSGLRWFSFDEKQSIFPMDIHWITYFQSDYVDKIGHERFAKLRVHQVQEVNNGLIIVTTESPFDSSLAQHQQIQYEIISQLELERFVVT